VNGIFALDLDLFNSWNVSTFHIKIKVEKIIIHYLFTNLLSFFFFHILMLPYVVLVGTIFDFPYLGKSMVKYTKK